MKAQVTRKYINTVYDDVFSVGYCGAYYLLKGVEPFAYNCGVYGWNCDYYYVNGVCICTGYRPHGKSTIGKTAEFEQRAKEICQKYYLSYEEEQKLLDKLRSEWIAKLLEG